MEYSLARKIGYTPDKIVFNGPIKGENLEHHLLQGGINNVDRIEEAIVVCGIADRYPDWEI